MLFFNRLSGSGEGSEEERRPLATYERWDGLRELYISGSLGSNEVG